jgi:hypothetical protein
LTTGRLQTSETELENVEEAMPIWLVKAVWREDESEASERWEVNAESAHEAVREATTHIRFQPHHVEASLRTCHEAKELRPGEVQRLPAE